VFIVVVYFVIDSVRKLLDTPSYIRGLSGPGMSSSVLSRALGALFKSTRFENPRKENCVLQKLLNSNQILYCTILNYEHSPDIREENSREFLRTEC
jgi:hypothetical protein